MEAGSLRPFVRWSLRLMITSWLNPFLMVAKWNAEIWAKLLANVSVLSLHHSGTTFTLTVGLFKTGTFLRAIWYFIPVVNWGYIIVMGVSVLKGNSYFTLPFDPNGVVWGCWNIFTGSVVWKKDKEIRKYELWLEGYYRRLQENRAYGKQSLTQPISQPIFWKLEHEKNENN
jgi:hypothetical protein